MFNNNSKKGTIEETEMEVVMVNQHPIPFPKIINSNRSSLHALTRNIQPIPTLNSPALSRARRVSQVQPGAYAVDGIRPMFDLPRSMPTTATIPDIEVLGLELVPTSQCDRDHDNGIIIADLVDDSENGEIPTAEPMTTKAKRLWKEKLFLFLSLEAIVAIAIVSNILLAFLLAPKSSNQTELANQQNGLIPIQENPGTIAPIAHAPLSLREILNLPEYTLRAMENPRSSQTKAYQWLSNNINNSNNTQHLPVWRLKQRFALATFFYSTRGDYWVKNQGWLDWDINECNWEQLQWFKGEPACDDTGQLLSLQLELGRLRRLEELRISGGELFGTLPTELGNLRNLTTLSFSSGNFSGSIPTEILQLSNLKTVSILECPLLDMTSFLPEVDGNLHNLDTLTLIGRKPGKFTSIPSDIGELTDLATLLLQDFQLNGTIPSEIGLLTNVNTLVLMRNYITGTLPEELSKMPQLKVLVISSNQLEGRPLEQDVLPQLTQLQWLRIDDNLFSGSIATEIGLWSSLEKLELQNTQISGTLPTELLLLDNLTSLVVMNTSLTGSIPDGLCDVILSPHEMKSFGGNDYAVPTTNLSVCYGTRLCGCTCEHCPKA
ncbi:Leucine Rich Repeat [Seminavis robusta]|uniref:Leucine Rich Repeat n=1 Tax=Seminavis robusta TaxID=568900 RepID=A0A9N8HII8_9STRA|nr:Leucine Rich Repeat [Seminavis robusta]|eukprot:Sro700_g189590.1 Leucine Rich Repeat (606) ;mRNA; r:8111-10431